MFNNNTQNRTLKAKIVLLGDDQAGKSQFLKRFCENHFSEEYQETIGGQYNTRNIMVNDTTVAMQLWDTRCHERFHSMLPTYLRGAHGAFILFPVDQPDSLSRVEWYLGQVRRHCPPDTFVILVGTKSDMRNDQLSTLVSRDELETLSMRTGCQYIETSAKQGINIIQPFDLVARDVLNRLPIQQENAQNRRFKAKVVLLGDDQAGKSQLLKRFCENTFSEEYKETIGAQFNTRSIMVNDTDVAMQLWDTRCHERFHSMLPTYLRGAQAALILFPVDQPGSLSRVEWYLGQVRRHCPPDTFVILVGTKCDLRNDQFSTLVSRDEIEALVVRTGCQYIETSAKQGINIVEPFDLVARDVLNRPPVQQENVPVREPSFCSIF